MRLKDAVGRRGNTERGYDAAPLVEERAGRIGRESFREIGAATLSGIAVEGELRDRQNATSHLEHRAVKRTLFAGENPEPHDLFCHRAKRRRGIGSLKADEQKEPRSDGADNGVINRNARLCDPLEYHPHEAMVSRDFRGAQ